MRALPPLALLVATAASCGQAPAPPPRTAIATRLLADAEARWVPFTLTGGNQVRFDVMLDGRSVPAILDTGVSATLLSDRSAAVDPARLGGETVATAIGGAVPVRWMATHAIAFGGLARDGGRVAVAPLPRIASGGEEPVELLVGADLLRGHALDIDYPRKRLRLLQSGRLPFAGASAPLGVSARGVYASAVTIGSATVRPAVIDTGDGSAVTVTQANWTAGGLDRLPNTTAIGYGLAGPLVTRLAIVPGLRVGELAARAVEVRSEPAGGFSQAIGAAGRIGSGLLGRYRVLLDPAAGRMVFSPGPDADRAPPRSTSGLLLGVARDRLTVVHVMANGPAAAAGWKAGDAICRIDGAPIPADYQTSALARWAAGTPGTTVRLGMCDGGARTLRLARFY